MNRLPTPRPLVVVILDGWGISFVERGNAIAAADTPTMDMFARHYPSAALLAASIEVGLPWGEVGNSETGHSNIGAGTVQYQALPRITQAIENGTFFQNQALVGAIEHARQRNSNLHLIGLASPGGVHAHMEHLFALLRLCREQNFTENVYLHIFTDGRDTPPKSAAQYVRTLEEAIGRHGVGRVASVTGRFYAMDRNENWDRTKAAYDMLTGGPRPGGAATALQAIEQGYQQNLNDETLAPTAITRGGGPIATIAPHDAVIFFNYRPDRARQLTRAFTEQNFTGFDRPPLDDLYFATMTQYDDSFTTVPAAFVEEPVPYPLARLISEAGLKQLHIAETEKYAHITYYLNGGHEAPFEGEDHVLIQSSAVKNFADEPRMGAGEITDRLLAELARGVYDICFVNYANADMVGHTGDFAKSVEACAFVDQCLQRLYQAVVPAGGALLVTADHGNAEELLNPQTGDMETDHTSNPVPLHYVYEPLRRVSARSERELAHLFSSPIGVLADVAPTVLNILNIEKPSDMAGISLLSSLQ